MVFTVEQANAMLPLVRAIVGDMVALSREVIERRQRLDQLNDGREAQVGDPYSDELFQIEQELDKDDARLQAFSEELLQLGVEPKGAAEGLVDFPAVIDGRMAYLCWQYNEPEILYWHELDAGFAGRKPLTADVTPGDADAGGAMEH